MTNLFQNYLTEDFFEKEKEESADLAALFNSSFLPQRSSENISKVMKHAHKHESDF